MAIFSLNFVLRRFPVAAYRKYASPKTLACLAIAVFWATADAALVSKRRRDFTSDLNMDVFNLFSKKIAHF